MSLSSLLVQRELATIRDVEEALARQVLYGGDLATNLLEVAHLDESRLTGLLAESYGLLPAPWGELPPVLPEARALVTKDQAMEQGIWPLALDGGALVIASSGPLTPEVEQELGFSTSRAIVVKIAPIFRIYQAIARDYGTTLLRRHARLLARLAAPPAGTSSPTTSASAPVLPAESAPVLPTESSPVAAKLASSIPPLTVVEPAVARARAHLEPEPAEPSERLAALPPEPLEAPIAPVPPEAAAPVWSEPSEPAAPVVEALLPEAEAERGPAAPVVEALLQEAEAERGPPTRQSEPPLPPQAPERPIPVVQVAELPSPEIPETLVSSEARAHKRQGKRRRGPLTFEMAKKEMDDASERDQVLDLFFEFSRQFFDYCAFFIVHADNAEGRDAAGHGALRDKVAGISVPLDAPSVLLAARKALVPIFVKPDPFGIDRVLFRDLERPRTSAVGLLPIVVRRRVVAVLLGDDGETNVDAAGVKDVTSFAALAGAAFERLIVRKKQGEKVEKLPSFAPRTPSVRPDASALGRAFGVAPAAPVVVEPVEPVEAPRVEPAPTPPPVEPARVEPLAEPVEAPAEAPPVQAAGREPSEPPPTIGDRAPSTMAARELSDILPREEPASEPPAEEASPVTPRVQSVPPDAPHEGFSLSEPAPPLEDIEHVVMAVPQPAKLPTMDQEPEHEPIRAFREEYPSSKRIVSVPVVARSEAAIHAASLETPHAPEVSSEPPASISVPAHLPPTRSDRPKVLPTVIVDVGNEYMELVDRVVRSSDDAAETRLLHAGQHAMPAILARFPGPVRLDVSALPEGALPRAGECGPVLRLIARQRRVALPFVLTLVDEPNADRRFWATYLLSELPYVEAIEPAVLALFDVEARVRLAARTSVRILGDLYPTYTVDRLARVLAEPNQLVVRRVIALQMLGEVRDPASVPHLLPRLVDPQPEVAAAARESLTLVSRQDFGLHLSHWNEWFDQNRGKQRVEWLIDALAHPSSHLRLSAVEELVKLTRNAFGYQDEMPKRERERVMQKFRDWWAVEGRARYGR